MSQMSTLFTILENNFYNDVQIPIGLFKKYVTLKTAMYKRPILTKS